MIHKRYDALVATSDTQKDALEGTETELSGM
jgi:hypothetical protein